MWSNGCGKEEEGTPGTMVSSNTWIAWKNLSRFLSKSGVRSLPWEGAMKCYYCDIRLKLPNQLLDRFRFVISVSIIKCLKLNLLNSFVWCESSQKYMSFSANCFFLLKKANEKLRVVEDGKWTGWVMWQTVHGSRIVQNQFNNQISTSFIHVGHFLLLFNHLQEVNQNDFCTYLSIQATW